MLEILHKIKNIKVNNKHKTRTSNLLRKTEGVHYNQRGQLELGSRHLQPLKCTLGEKVVFEFKDEKGIMVDYCTFPIEIEIPKTQEYPNFKNKIQSSSSAFNYPKQDISTTSSK